MSAIKVQKKSFDSVEKNTSGLLYLESPLPQIIETTRFVDGGRVYHALVLPTKNKDMDQFPLAIMMDYQTLLQVGRHIVRALDPSPKDQAVDELKEIRKLLEDQN